MTAERATSAGRGGLLEEMTWEEVAAAAKAGLPVVVPTGSTEQHGPHLPLNTDCVIPVAIALQASRSVPLVVAPPVHYGARSRALSGGGESFPGTLSLSAPTLMAVIEQVLDALARSGFKRLCLLNWHYENAGYLWEAADNVAARRKDVRILVLEHPLPAFTEEELAELFPNGFTGWDLEHASNLETSMMFVLRPDLVRRELIADDAAARHPSWDVVPAPPEFVPASGVLSKPTDATEAAGRRFLDAAAGRLAGALREEFGL